MASEVARARMLVCSAFLRMSRGLTALANLDDNMIKKYCQTR